MSQKERCPAAEGEDLRVQIQGLKSRQDLNLRVGEVVGKGTRPGRWAVKLEGLEKPLSIKQSNLLPLRVTKNDCH